MGHAVSALGLALVSWRGCSASAEAVPPPTRHPPTAEIRLATAGLAEPPAKIRVLVGGDLLPHRPMLVPPERLRSALDPLASLLGGADVAVANYEAATGDPARMGPRDISLAATPAWLGAAGERFGALTFANNHACDLGKRGLDATIDAAREAGVIALGVDPRDPWRPRVLVEKAGHRVCAVAWTTFVNTDTRACPSSGKIAIAGLDGPGEHTVSRAVAAARGAGCDATIAIVHGGQEYETQEWPDLAVARIAAEAGADAVILHHPHVPSPVHVYETRDGRHVPVFVSVGNLVSNQGESYRAPLPATPAAPSIAANAWTRLGVVADLEWTWPVGSRPRERPALAYGYHLTWTDNDHAAHRADPMPRIATRALERGDPVVLQLSRDRKGPTGLFDDECWLARGVTRCPMPASSAGALEGSASLPAASARPVARSSSTSARRPVRPPRL